MPKKKLGSELQGITRLIADATIGVTDLVEAMHKRVVHPPLLPSTPIQHLITFIAGITYRNIRWSTRLIGNGVDKALGRLTSVIGDIDVTDDREAIRSVLNGVVGDYLEQHQNPLKITMQFRYQGKMIVVSQKGIEDAYTAVNGKVLLMIHGSCMNDIQWTRKDHNHGTALANELTATPAYLYYNSGRHISSNGQELNALLEDLVGNWPVPIDELIIVAHSMGGLVSRSALYYGQEQHKTWTGHLKKMVFLGTPHHGAPMEKAGNYLDVILEATPYAKPFAKLGKIRSAGVTDLRYGNLVDKDWQDKDRFLMQADQRQTIGLPDGIICYGIAGTIGEGTGSISSRLLGDSMVSVKSALGQHKNTARNLSFKEENTWIAHQTNHSDLLSNTEVYTKMKEWLVS